MPLSQPGTPEIEELKACRDVTGLINKMDTEKDLQLRRNVIKALGEVCDHRVTYDRFMSKINLIKTGQSGFVRQDTFEWLEVDHIETFESHGRLVDTRSVGVLVSALEDPDAGIRAEAAEALGRIGDPRTADTLTRALSDPVESVRSSAQLALTEINDQSGLKRDIDTYAAILKDEMCEDRSSAARDLGDLKSPLAVDVLVEALKDPDGHVRSSAAEALGKIGERKAVDALIAALDAPHVYHRLVVAEALVAIGDPKATDVLVDLVLNDWYDMEDIDEEQFMAAMVRLDPSRIIEKSIAALNDPDYIRREGAIRILEKIDSPEAVDGLIIALNDPEAEIRDMVIDILGEINDPGAVNALIKSLQDPNAILRSRTARLLGKLGKHGKLDQYGKECKTRVSDSLKALYEDRDADVRYDAGIAWEDINYR